MINAGQKQELLRLWLIFVRAFNAYMQERGLPTVDFDPNQKNGTRIICRASFSVQKRDKDGKFAKEGGDTAEEIERLIDKALTAPHEYQKAVIGKVSRKLIDDLEKDGFTEDISDFEHDVDTNGIRHLFSQHGDVKKEKARKQLAITPDDVKKIPEIINGYDEVEYTGINWSGQDSIRYRKNMPDGTIYYVEEVRIKKKRLTSKTMYKKKPKP